MYTDCLMGNLYSRMGYFPLPGRDPTARERLQSIEDRLTTIEALTYRIDDRLDDIESLKIIQRQMIQESMELRKNLEMPMGNFLKPPVSSLTLSKKSFLPKNRFKASTSMNHKEAFFECIDGPLAEIENMGTVQKQLMEDLAELRNHLNMPSKKYSREHPLGTSYFKQSLATMDE